METNDIELAHEEELQEEEGAVLPPSDIPRSTTPSKRPGTEASPPLLAPATEPSRRTMTSSIHNRGPLLLPAIIVPFATLGVLIRLGLVSITTFPGQQVFSLAWPQFLGCLFMGLFVSIRPWILGEQGFSFADHHDLLHDHVQGQTSKGHGHWIGAFVYVGLSSGLCGSITTFSSWALAIFKELVNTTQVEHHPAQNLIAGLTELIVTLAMSFTGLQLGTHLGQALLPARTLPSTTTTLSLPPSIPPSPPNHWTFLDIAIIVLSSLLWIATLLASIFTPIGSRSSWRHVVLATCFAPLGAILRWYLSRFNTTSSPRLKNFPLGTFLANVVGSWILAALACLQHSSVVPSLIMNGVGCQVLSGLQDGFCGCLTTISTFALEIKNLPRRASYIYAIATVLLAELGMLVILGTFVWTRPPEESYGGSRATFEARMCRM